MIFRLFSTTCRIFATLLVFASVARAADSQTSFNAGGSNVTSTANSDEIHNSNVMENLFLGLTSNFRGPGVTRFGSPYTNTSTGFMDKNKGMNFDSDVTAAYLFTPTVGLGVIVPFFYVPTQGHDFVLGDVGIKFFNRKFLTTSTLNVSSSAILQASTSDYSRSIHQSFAVKLAQNVRYLIPDSRFTLGSFVEEKAYVGVQKGKTFKLWAAPFVNYQLTPNLSANLLYEIEAHHLRDTQTLNFVMHQSDLCPGFIYLVTPKVAVNPYLQIYTTDGIALDRTGVGALITASL